MRTMSISVEDELYERLKHSVPSKKISQFVSKAILQELTEIEKELSLAYEEAEASKERNILLTEWDATDELFKD